MSLKLVDLKFILGNYEFTKKNHNLVISGFPFGCFKNFNHFNVISITLYKVYYMEENVESPQI
jgi:hypothetical protein